MCVCVCALSCVQVFETPGTVAHQAPLTMGFPRQEYWSRLPFPSPADLPDPRIEPVSPELQKDSLPLEPLGIQEMHDVCYLMISFVQIPSHIIQSN